MPHGAGHQGRQGALAQRRVPPARTADGTRRGGPATRSRVRAEALSRRQAYRYLQEAAGLSAPLPAVEPTVAVTFKLPVSTVRAIRAYARHSGLSLGQVVTQAVTAFLDNFRQRRG